MQREEIQLLIISLSIVLFTLLLTLFILFYFFQKKKSRFLIEKMESDLLFHSELTKSRMEIKEQTLSTVSKELHDNVGQILSVALMQMNIIIEDGQKYTPTSLVDLRFLVNKSLNEIRMLSKLMNQENLLQSGFIDAVSDDLERINQLQTIKCTLNVTGEVRKINKEHQTIIYRMLQESISNILRHSQSETISIDIRFTDKSCRIRILDSGRGFDPQISHRGNGLNNITTRAEIIGAKVDIRSEAGQGAAITIDYPIADAKEAYAYG